MASSAADLTTRLLRHERGLVACTTALLAAFGWAFLLRGMPMRPTPPPLTALIAMWWLMMLAMMLPSATPAVMLYARVRQVRGGDEAIARTWIFLAGYLTVWLLFSIAAALVQSVVARQTMAIQSRPAQIAVLILAGLHQLSPFKAACISQCRAPGQFISAHWRPGWSGAVRLGALHGLYCVGCCWMLMGLLFVGGVMNLSWVMGLTIIVAGEKLLPAWLQLPKISGVALLLWALWRMLT